MTRCLTVLRPLALAAALAAGGAAQANITIYTDEAAFMAALEGSLIGTDTFNDFVSASGPVSRSAGDLQYTVDASPKDNLIRTGGDDGWLSAGSKRNTLNFGDFTASTFAAGAFFFGTSDNEPASKGVVVVKAFATDESAERQITLTKRTDNFFVGFISDAPLTSVTAKYLGGSGALVTVNDLTLAAPAVPEPETYALLLSGLAVVGFVARRRREP